jgi:hypothetical protein
MNISAIHRGRATPGSACPAAGRLSCESAARHAIPLAGAVGLIILASACASMTPRPASVAGTRPRHVTAPAAVGSRRPPAAAASQPAPAAPPATGTTSSPGPAAAGYTGPHFTTPQAAMTYMAAAYNNDEATAMHAVTDPQAFTSLQAMRSTDSLLRLTSCTPTPRGDYMCSFRYDGGGGHDPRPQTAMVITAPALNPGWYMYRFIYGCD